MKWQEKIERCMRSRGESRGDLAAATGIDVAALHKRLGPRATEPSYDELLTIARHLDVSLDWLLDPRKGWPATPGSAADRSVELATLLQNALNGFLRPVELSEAAGSRVIAAAQAPPPSARESGGLPRQIDSAKSA